MNKLISSRLLMVLTMLFGALSAAWAADRLYAEAVNFEPGETKQIAFNLENSQEFFGFQTDITLPDGLEVVMLDGKADFRLSTRVNSSFVSVSNKLSVRTVRVGAFSTDHTAISGDSGTLFYLNIHASDSYAGGTLSLTNILFTNATDNDIELPDFTVELGSQHNDTFYIPDFTITVGETKEISLILDNETPFTAFQTDIYMPEGLTIVDGSPAMTSRGTDHTLSSKTFGDGRVRLVCLSVSNSLFTGHEGALVSLQIMATKDMAETCQIEMRNQRFSMANAKEYILPNSTALITIEPTPATGISIIYDGKTSLYVGETIQLSATVTPEDATDKSVTWQTESSEIVSVDNTGLVTAIGVGEAWVSATNSAGQTDSIILNVKQLDTDVTSISFDDVTLKIEKSQITVENLPTGQIASVYSLSGVCLMQQVSFGEDVVFEVVQGQIYIVRFGREALKIAVQ